MRDPEPFAAAHLLLGDELGQPVEDGAAGVRSQTALGPTVHVERPEVSVTHHDEASPVWRELGL
jgi:hypothetical protein